MTEAGPEIVSESRSEENKETEKVEEKNTTGSDADTPDNTSGNEATEEPKKLPILQRIWKYLFGCVKKRWRGLLAIVLLYSVGLLFSTFLQDEVQDAAEYFSENGFLGILLFILSYTVLLQIGVPSTVMEIGVAFIFDEFYKIFLINTLAKNIGKATGFFIGKYLLHDWVKKHLLDDSQPLTQALGRLIKREPLKYSTLWAFAYVPTWSQTFGLPVLGCPFWVFVISQNIAGIPYSILWTFVGITARDTIEDVQNGEDIDVAKVVATVIGILFLIVSIVLGGYYVRKELKSQEEVEVSRERRETELAAELSGGNAAAEELEEGEKPVEEVPAEQQRKISV